MRVVTILPGERMNLIKEFGHLILRVKILQLHVCVHGKLYAVLGVHAYSIYSSCSQTLLVCISVY